MTRFKTREELEDFENNSAVCVCGRLMTGLHISYCNKWTKEKKKALERFNKQEKEG